MADNAEHVSNLALLRAGYQVDLPARHAALDAAILALSPAAAGETDHPEALCNRCGLKNVIGWSAPNELWNRVVGSPNGILCPQCFVQRAERVGERGPWTLAPVTQPQGVVGDETRDAARWRALVGSARVRVIGSAGLRTNIDPYGNPWDGYAHIGLELWTKHAPDAINEPPDAVEWLTKYADTAALHPPTREGQPDGR